MQAAEGPLWYLFERNSGPMLDFLSEQNGGLCGSSHLKRREFLQVGALSALGLSLPQYLAAKEAGALKAELIVL